VYATAREFWIEVLEKKKKLRAKEENQEGFNRGLNEVPLYMFINLSDKGPSESFYLNND
jgi:hypothetical protein